jgi:hypothetical protein
MEALYRVMFEDTHLDPIEDWDVYETREAAMAAFADVIAHPADGLGSVYVTEDHDDHVVVIAGHYFVDPSAVYDGETS